MANTGIFLRKGDDDYFVSNPPQIGELVMRSTDGKVGSLSQEGNLVFQDWDAINQPTALFISDEIDGDLGSDGDKLVIPATKTEVTTLFHPKRKLSRIIRASNSENPEIFGINMPPDYMFSAIGEDFFVVSRPYSSEEVYTYIWEDGNEGDYNSSDGWEKGNDDITEVGVVHLYSYDSSGATKLMEIHSPDPQKNGHFGNSNLRIVGDTFIVGAPQEDLLYDREDYSSNVRVKTRDTGSVYWFRKDGTLIGEILDRYNYTGDNFGNSIASNDNYIVISDSEDPSVSLYDISGHFIRDISEPNGKVGSMFGYNIFISSDNKIYVADSPFIVSGGRILVFDVSGNLLNILTSPDIYTNFGAVIVEHGDFIYMNAHDSSLSLSGRGSKYPKDGCVYKLQKSDLSITHKFTRNLNGVNKSTEFGFSFCIASNKMIITAMKHSESNSIKHQPQIFKLDGEFIMDLVPEMDEYGHTINVGASSMSSYGEYCLAVDGKNSSNSNIHLFRIHEVEYLKEYTKINGKWLEKKFGLTKIELDALFEPNYHNETDFPFLGKYTCEMDEEFSTTTDDDIATISYLRTKIRSEDILYLDENEMKPDYFPASNNDILVAKVFEKKGTTWKPATFDPLNPGVIWNDGGQIAISRRNYTKIDLLRGMESSSYVKASAANEDFIFLSYNIWNDEKFSKFDLNGEIIWEKDIDCNSIVLNSNHVFTMDNNGWIRKFDFDGNEILVIEDINGFNYNNIMYVTNSYLYVHVQGAYSSLYDWIIFDISNGQKIKELGIDSPYNLGSSTFNQKHQLLIVKKLIKPSDLPDILIYNSQGDLVHTLEIHPDFEEESEDYIDFGGSLGSDDDILVVGSIKSPIMVYSLLDYQMMHTLDKFGTRDRFSTDSSAAIIRVKNGKILVWDREWSIFRYDGTLISSGENIITAYGKYLPITLTNERLLIPDEDSFSWIMFGYGRIA